MPDSTHTYYTRLLTLACLVTSSNQLQVRQPRTKLEKAHTSAIAFHPYESRCLNVLPVVIWCLSQNPASSYMMLVSNTTNKSADPFHLHEFSCLNVLPVVIWSLSQNPASRNNCYMVTVRGQTTSVPNSGSTNMMPASPANPSAPSYNSNHPLLPPSVLCLRSSSQRQAFEASHHADQTHRYKGSHNTPPTPRLDLPIYVDKSSGRGLSLNGSQFGGCSTMYNTLAGT